MTFLLAFWKPIAIGIAVIALVAAVGIAKHRYDNGKRDEGRAEVQAEWELRKAAELAATNEQEQKWLAERDARETAERERDDERAKRTAMAADAAKRLPDRVARVVVPRESARVLQSAVDSSNSAAASRITGKTVETVTPVTADTDVGKLTTWGVEVIAVCSEYRDRVLSLIEFYESFRKAQRRDLSPTD